MLVTSASHMPRAIAHFRAVGLAQLAKFTTPLHADDDSAGELSYWVPSANHLHKTERALSEALGRLALNFE